MTWFYNSHSGELTSASGVLAAPYAALIHAGIGWHELAIPGSASESQAAAEALREVPGGAKPTTSIAGGTAQAAGNVAAGAASAAAKGVANATGTAQFLGMLSNRAFIIRVVKVLIGAAMVIVGVTQVTGVAGKIKVLPV